MVPQEEYRWFPKNKAALLTLSGHAQLFLYSVIDQNSALFTVLG
jgi:hypothetical protein